MKKNNFIDNLIFITFHILKIFLLIATIVIAQKDSASTAEKYDFCQINIFILTLIVFLLDYIFSIFSTIITYIKDGKFEQFWNINSVLLMLAVFFIMATNCNTEDLIKSSAVIVIFLSLKYISNIKPQTIESNKRM